MIGMPAPDPALLVNRRPPTRWQEGLPLGDGGHGMLAALTRADDRLWLSGSDHWLRPLPEDRPRPSLAHLLPELRELVRAGRAAEAEARWQAEAKAAGYPYICSELSHPGAEVRIQAQAEGPLRGWRRWLDCRTGVAGSRWEDPAGLWSKGAVASRADRVMAWWWRPPRPGGCTARIGLGIAGGDRVALWRHGDLPLDGLRRVEIRAAAGGLALLGRTTHGAAWCWLLRARAEGGTAAVAGDALAVHAADALTLVMAGAVGGDPERLLDEAAARLDACPGDGPAIAARHAPLQAALVGRCTLDLGGADAGCTEDALAAARDGRPPLRLAEHGWWLGRHLLVASLREDGAFPPHLQGVWNATWQPPWFGNYTNDENVQMCHWHACPGGLPELLGPLRRWLSRSRDGWAANARTLFGCDGLLAPLMQGGTGARADAAEWHLWTAGAGWLARHLWELWEHTGDRALLADELLPLLDGTARFWRDWLQPDGDGRLHACPSLSVENTPAGWGARTAIDATMDIAVCREVVGRLVEARRLLGLDAAGTAAWAAFADRLPAYRVNPDGALAEWIEPRCGDEYRHRHQSHLYPLFPGEEIGPRHPLFPAAHEAARRRRTTGQAAQTGWSLVHLAHVNARLGDGAAAAACLDALWCGCAMDHLLLCHNDWRGQGMTMGGLSAEAAWQIDASLGYPSALAALLVRDAGDDLELLPALPPGWTRGRLAGLRIRGGGSLDLAWDGDRGAAELRQGFRVRTPVAGPGWGIAADGPGRWILART